MERIHLAIGLSMALMAMPLIGSSAVMAEPVQPWPTWRNESGYTYYKERRTSKPERGYSGFAGPGNRQSFCDYRRIPNRECKGGKCRVVSWTLQQYCY